MMLKSIIKNKNRFKNIYDYIFPLFTPRIENTKKFRTIYAFLS